MSVALACRAFSISQRCFRYVPLLADGVDRGPQKLRIWIVLPVFLQYSGLQMESVLSKSVILDSYRSINGKITTCKRSKMQYRIAAVTGKRAQYGNQLCCQN